MLITIISSTKQYNTITTDNNNTNNNSNGTWDAKKFTILIEFNTNEVT